LRGSEFQNVGAATVDAGVFNLFEDGSGLVHGTSVEHEVTEEQRVSPPGKLTKGKTI